MPRVLALAAALWCLAGCAPAAMPWHREQTFSSMTPVFEVRYPAGWHQSTGQGPDGPTTVFSPARQPEADDPRITLLVTTAQPRNRVPGQKARPLILSSPRQPTTEGLLVQRWFVTWFPYGMLIEAYAAEPDSDRILAVADQMVQDIVAQQETEHDPWQRLQIETH